MAKYTLTFEDKNVHTGSADHYDNMDGFCKRFWDLMQKAQYFTRVRVDIVAEDPKEEREALPPEGNFKFTEEELYILLPATEAEHHRLAEKGWTALSQKYALLNTKIYEEIVRLTEAAKGNINFYVSYKGGNTSGGTPISVEKAKECFLRDLDENVYEIEIKKRPSPALRDGMGCLKCSTPKGPES